MTISWRTATGLTAGTSASLTWTLPTGHTVGDLLVAIYGGKPYSATSGTPTDYATNGSVASGTNANGNGAGSTRAQVFTKTHDGSESNPTATVSEGPSPSMVAMLAASKTEAGNWLLASTTGADSTLTGTAISATGADSLTVRSGERVVVVSVGNDNLETETSAALAIGSATFTITEVLASNTTTTGNDGSMHVYDCLVTGGGTGAPVFTATSSRSGNSTRAVVFLHVWEPVNRSQDDPVGVTDSLALTFSKALPTEAIGIASQASRNIAVGPDAIGATDSLFVEPGKYVDETGLEVSDSTAITLSLLLTDDTGLLAIEPDHALTGGATLVEDDEDVTDSVVLDRSIQLPAEPIGVADSLHVEHGLYQSETGLGVTDSQTFSLSVEITDGTGLVALEPTMGDSAFNYTRDESDDVGLLDTLHVVRGLYQTEGSIGIADDEIIVDKSGPDTYAVSIEDSTGLNDFGGYFDVADELEVEDIGIADEVTLRHVIPVGDDVGVTDSIAKHHNIGLSERETPDPDIVEVIKPTGTNHQRIPPADLVGLSDVGQPDVVHYVPSSITVLIEDTVTLRHQPPDADWTGYSARGAEDRVGITDSASALLDVAKSETINVTDQTAIIKVVGISDSAGVTDRIANINRGFTGWVGISDGVDVLHERRGYISVPVPNGVDVTDEVTVVVNHRLTVSDVLDIVDLNTLRSPNLKIGVSDVVGPTEEVDTFGWTRRWKLTTPTVREAPIGGGRLFSFYKMPRGISLLVNGTTVTQKRWPTIEELEACDAYYLGGHMAEISEDEAQVLIDAGYSDHLEPSLAPTF